MKITTVYVIGQFHCWTDWVSTTGLMLDMSPGIQLHEALCSKQTFKWFVVDQIQGVGNWCTYSQTSGPLQI